MLTQVPRILREQCEGVSDEILDVLFSNCNVLSKVRDACGDSVCLFVFFVF
jgi:hypothetical protein